MGSINIIDSGYLSSDNTGTRATNLANSGAVITLKTADFTPSLKRNVSSNPELGTTDPSEVNLGSLENMNFTIRCVLNTKNVSDMDTVQHLLDVIETPGYKFLWYSFADETIENNNGQLIYRIAQNSRYGDEFTAGEQATFSVSNAFKHLHVYLYDIQPRHDSNSKLITYQMQGIVLKVKPSQI